MNQDLLSASILIVDDIQTNCNLLRSLLLLEGFSHVMVATHGQTALGMMAEHLPDLVLLDVRMPDLDGFEVTRRIRAAYPDRFIPIILISTLDEPQDRVRGIQVGANDFLSRPFDVQELLARIHSLLALKRMRDELDADRQRLALLNEVSRLLTAQLDYGALTHQIVTLALNLTGANKAVLIALDEEGKFSHKVIAYPHQPPRSTSTIDRRVLDEGLLGWVLCKRQAVVVEDTHCDPRWVELADDEEAAAALAVPLLRGDEVVGALLVTSPQVGAFGTEHLNLLLAVGSHAAIALENARLYEEARRQRARTEILLNQTGDPVIVADGEGRITRINPAARRILDLDDATLGRSVEEVFGLGLSDLLLRAQERHSAVSGGYTRRIPDSEPRTFHVSVSPIEGVGYLMVWQDITALKEGEQARLRSEQAERERVLTALSRYMSPALIKRVLSDPHILRRRERREAYVLFADLRGFTRLTVEHAADDVMALLNDVFAEMMEIVYEHEGVVFDIAGDELMIGFNVPYDQPDAPQRTLATAIAMQRRFADLKAKWAQRGMRVGMGIGINHGPVVLGHVGGRDRMNYAMVGEAVTIAHRLVELAADGQIIATPSTLPTPLPTFEGVTMRELPPQVLKGRAEPLALVAIEVG